LIFGKCTVKTKVLMIVLVFGGLAAVDGNVQHWTMELGSIPSAQLIGWNRGSLAAGDVVTLYVWQAKTKEPVGRFNKVEFSDGTVLRDTQRGADDGGRADTGVRQ
jgi:hypothetical protein